MRLTPEERDKKKKAQILSNKCKLFLHVPYHPHDPPSSVIQKLFRDHVLFPDGEAPLYEIRNHLDEKIEKDGLITCYHRHPNLGNLFSVRKICKKEGSDTATAWRTRQTRHS